jgi:hypothetical protein
MDLHNKTKTIDGKEHVWNPVAYDYKSGTIIYDCETMVEYTQEQALQLPKETQQRLCLKTKKTGCWVLSLKEIMKRL